MNVKLLTLSALLSLAAAQQDLNFGYECKGFQTYNFYDNGNEVDIGFNIGVKTKTSNLYVLQTGNVGVRPRCFTSNIGTRTFAYDSEVVFPYVDKDGTIVNIVAPLPTTVTVATPEQSLLDLISLVENPGFLGYTWISRPDGQKDVILNQFLNAIPAAYNVIRYECPTGAISADEDAKRMNCIHDGTNIDDYFLNDISYTWALWVLIILMLFYFFSTMCIDDVIPLDYVPASNWTYHPAVSFWTRGSEIFTKQSRFANYIFFVASCAFFLALMHLRWYDQKLAIRIVVLPFFSTIFALITTLITGYVLTKTYAIHWEFVNGYKAAQTHDERRTNLDNYERRQFKATYIFYVLLIFGLAHFFIWPIYIFYDAPLDIQGFWVVGIAIAVAFDMLVWRMLFVALGNIAFFARWFKMYGDWYDQKLHEEYTNIVGYKM